MLEIILVTLFLFLVYKTIKEIIDLDKKGYELNPLLMFNGEGMPMVIIGQPDNIFIKITTVISVIYVCYFLISNVIRFVFKYKK